MIHFDFKLNIRSDFTYIDEFLSSSCLFASSDSYWVLLIFRKPSSSICRWLPEIQIFIMIYFNLIEQRRFATYLISPFLTCWSAFPDYRTCLVRTGGICQSIVNSFEFPLSLESKSKLFTSASCILLSYQNKYFSFPDIPDIINIRYLLRV